MFNKININCGKIFLNKIFRKTTRIFEGACNIDSNTMRRFVNEFEYYANHETQTQFDKKNDMKIYKNWYFAIRIQNLDDMS